MLDPSTYPVLLRLFDIMERRVLMLAFGSVWQIVFLDRRGTQTQRFESAPSYSYSKSIALSQAHAAMSRLHFSLILLRILHCINYRLSETFSCEDLTN
jgi:hypothetical protein